VVLHFGMHGTVEWLPGSPLGNTGLSWSDVLLGELPNVYVYAANNPSESIVAKRRGYGTIVSHNVPPYGRAGVCGRGVLCCGAPAKTAVPVLWSAKGVGPTVHHTPIPPLDTAQMQPPHGSPFTLGKLLTPVVLAPCCCPPGAGLYKQLAQLRELLGEYRENPEAGGPLVAPILAAVVSAGLGEDVAWTGPTPMDPEQADSIDPQVGGPAGRQPGGQLCGAVLCRESWRRPRGFQHVHEARSMQQPTLFTTSP
jgi:hypothetical protein